MDKLFKEWLIKKIISVKIQFDESEKELEILEYIYKEFFGEKK